MADTKLSQLTLKTGNMVASDLVEITEGGNTTKSVTGTKILGFVSASITGITTSQANAITANTAKTGITSGQANAITANTAKVTNATHSGEVTGATSLTIANAVVDEANLKVSNNPTNGYVLTAQSGNAGGLTWGDGSTITSTGALNSGSITSGFGTINNGASTITTTGVITGGTVEATTDTAAGDNAAMGYTAAEGLILTGQGSSNDVTIKNDADATVMSIPTGTRNVSITAGDLTAAGNLFTPTGNLRVQNGTVSAPSMSFNNYSNMGMYARNSSTMAFSAGGNRIMEINSTSFWVDSIKPLTGTDTLSIYLGGTGSSNELDDYEEGTWTPAVGYAGGSPSTGYAAQLGNYVKIGNMVTANLYIVTNAHSAGTGQLSISGFPFTAKPDNTYHSGTIGYMQGIAGGATTNTIISFLSGNTTAMAIKSTNNSAVGNIAFTDATHIMVNITYQTA